MSWRLSAFQVATALVPAAHLSHANDVKTWVSTCLCRSEISLELLDYSYLFKKVACVDGNVSRISVCGK